MDKEQKYVDYIVADMIKDTNHYTDPDNDNDIAISFPMEPWLEERFTLIILRNSLGEEWEWSGREDEVECEYLINKYGVPDDLIEIIYDTYWDQLVRHMLTTYS